MSIPNPLPPVPALQATHTPTRTVSLLFRKYEEIGFLYPAKKALLMPHFDRIRSNWRRMFSSKEQLMWSSDYEDQERGHFASIVAWRQSNHGFMAQHLVSDGNPFLSLRVMLAAQARVIHSAEQDQIRSSQNWFRPDNRYAYRIFASMIDSLGTKKGALNLFHYFHQPLPAVTDTSGTALQITELTAPDAGFTKLATRLHGEVFVRGEELDLADLCQDKLDAVYGQYGLSRYRRVFKVMTADGKRLLGGAVVNRAPLGINFSFLENRCYYLLADDLQAAERQRVVAALNATVAPYYQDLELGCIPVVTTEENGAALLKSGARLIRAYYQSIWLREGFKDWYDHINSFLQRIEARASRS